MRISFRNGPNVVFWGNTIIFCCCSHEPIAVSGLWRGGWSLLARYYRRDLKLLIILACCVSNEIGIADLPGGGGGGHSFHFTRPPSMFNFPYFDPYFLNLASFLVSWLRLTSDHRSKFLTSIYGAQKFWSLKSGCWSCFLLFMWIHSYVTSFLLFWFI